MCVTEFVVVVSRVEGGWLVGEVRCAGDPALPFVGWIGLLSALEAAIGDR